MATIGKRAATWSNSDGLVIGFGTNSPAIAGAPAKFFPFTELALWRSKEQECF